MYSARFVITAITPQNVIEIQITMQGKIAKRTALKKYGCIPEIEGEMQSSEYSWPVADPASSWYDRNYAVIAGQFKLKLIISIITYR